MTIRILGILEKETFLNFGGWKKLEPVEVHI